MNIVCWSVLCSDQFGFIYVQSTVIIEPKSKHNFLMTIMMPRVGLDKPVSLSIDLDSAEAKHYTTRNHLETEARKNHFEEGRNLGFDPSATGGGSSDWIGWFDQ